MKIAVGCDHGGINLKPFVEKVLKDRGIEMIYKIGRAHV